ncbi:MAG: hydrophobic protein [Solirubrobacteraceae bacterium]
MVAVIVLLLILALFGLGGLALHLLWYVLVGLLILWAIGFLVNSGGGTGMPVGGRRRWYGRW